LLVTTFLIIFLKVFSLQGKDASKPAGNWFQLLMVLFTKEYLSTSYARDIIILVSGINVFEKLTCGFQRHACVCDTVSSELI
jgi:hypothetical protein